MKKQERKRLIRQISQVSGVAQYALDARMSDEQVSEAAQNLNALGLIKAANDYNRYCQGQKTRAANEKLEELKNFMKSQWEDSTTYHLGKRIWNALTKTGEERKQELLKDDLVHKEDYNQMASSYRDALETQREGYSENIEQMKHLKDVYEDRLKTLKHQLEKMEEAVEYHHGASGLKKVKTMVRRETKADQG